MIISASTDYRAAAKRRLPPFLFHYIDGGAYAEHTLRRNVSDLADIALRQRVLRDMADLSLDTTLFGERLAMPVALAPVGLTGMYARRSPCPPCRCARSRKWRRRSGGRCGSSCTCCATGASCAMRWSARRRRA